MFGKDKNTNDPEKALNDAEKKLNKGFTGFATKAFMGKDYVDKMNETMAMGHEAIDMQKASQNLNQIGIPAVAKVLSIQDTGELVNYDPMVILKLEVTPQTGVPFETTAKTIVSKIAIPRVGDTINIKYSPTDLTSIVVL